MIVDTLKPPRLLVATPAHPIEVAAVAVVAAREASDVFSAAVVEQSSGHHHVDFVVVSPLAHDPSIRVHVSWVVAAEGVVVSVDSTVTDLAVGADRVRRARRAVDRFVELLEGRLR